MTHDDMCEAWRKVPVLFKQCFAHDGDYLFAWKRREYEQARMLPKPQLTKHVQIWRDEMQDRYGDECD